MSAFLKEAKVLTELSKGVQSMKQFLYPTLLQKEALPIINKKV